jgi:hypothetical protein
MINYFLEDTYDKTYKLFLPEMHLFIKRNLIIFNLKLNLNYLKKLVDRKQNRKRLKKFRIQ